MEKVIDKEIICKLRDHLSRNGMYRQALKGQDGKIYVNDIYINYDPEAGEVDDIIIRRLSGIPIEDYKQTFLDIVRYEHGVEKDGYELMLELPGELIDRYKIAAIEEVMTCAEPTSYDQDLEHIELYADLILHEVNIGAPTKNGFAGLVDFIASKASDTIFRSRY